MKSIWCKLYGHRTFNKNFVLIRAINENLGEFKCLCCCKEFSYYRGQTPIELTLSIKLQNTNLLKDLLKIYENAENFERCKIVKERISL